MKRMQSNYLVYLKLGLVIAAFAVASALVHQCNAQQVVITKKDGTKTEGKVIGTNTSAVFLPGQTINYSEISSVQIVSTGKQADDFAALCATNKIEVTINGEVTEGIKQTILATQPKPTSVDELAKSIDDFRIARQGAKGMQAAGILTIAASIVMQTIYKKQWDKEMDEWSKYTVNKPAMPVQKTVSPAIPAIGAGIALIGFGMDIGAGAKLKLR